MGGIHILPNFVVQTGGKQTLRVVTLDFLRQRGFDPNTGFGFSKAMSDRYGGKKLKLYKVFTDPDCEQVAGATRRLSFSADGDDTYRWNEYMFQEYWDAVGDGKPRPIAREANPTREPVRKPQPARVERPVERVREYTPPAPAPKKRQSSLLKVLIIMSLLNAQNKPVEEAPKPSAKARSAQ